MIIFTIDKRLTAISYPVYVRKKKLESSISYLAELSTRDDGERTEGMRIAGYHTWIKICHKGQKILENVYFVTINGFSIYILTFRAVLRDLQFLLISYAC